MPVDPATMQALSKGGEILAGGIGGGISNYQNQKAKRAELNRLIKGAEQMQREIDANEQLRTGQAQNAYGGLLEGFQGNASDYYSMLQNTDMTDYVQQAPEDFTFNKLAEIDAYKGRNQSALDEMINRELGGIKADGAASGSLFSGATGKNIARSTADIVAASNKEAEGYAQNEEANQYQKYMDRFNQASTLANQKMSAVQGNIANRGNLFNTQAGMFGNLRNETTGIQSASDAARFASRAEEEAARAQKAGTTRGASSFFQGFGAGLGG